MKTLTAYVATLVCLELVALAAFEWPGFAQAHLATANMEAPISLAATSSPPVHSVQFAPCGYMGEWYSCSP
jgi:hypothetical protein